MNNLIEKTKNLYNNEKYDELYDFVEDQLKQKATENSIDTWLTLAIVIAEVPIVDFEKSMECLQKALQLDNNNPTTMLILAYISRYNRGEIDSASLKKIENLHSNSDEVNSMLKYAISLFYDNNRPIQEKLLKESINLCTNHVWNYVDLAKIYFSQGRDDEARELAKKALDNVQRVSGYGFKKKAFRTGFKSFDSNNINDYINERIKGIYLSGPNLEFIEEMLEEKQDD